MSEYFVYMYTREKKVYIIKYKYTEYNRAPVLSVFFKRPVITNWEKNFYDKSPSEELNGDTLEKLGNRKNKRDLHCFKWERSRVGYHWIGSLNRNNFCRKKFLIRQLKKK